MPDGGTIIEAGDASLYVESDGAGTPPIVFVHGGTGSHQHWMLQVAALRGSYRCVTYDARGFGRSTGAPHVRGIDGHAEDLLAVVDGLGIERAVLVGHSMGGYAVSGVARDHPERVVGLVMVDTPFGLPTSALAAWARDMIVRLEAGFDVVAACTAPDFARRRPDLAFLLESIVRGNPRRDGPRGLDAYHQMVATPPADLTGWRVPTLFVVGEHDALTVPDLIKATAAAVPGARVITITDAGHSPNVEQADAFNRALVGFVEGLAAAGRP